MKKLFAIMAVAGILVACNDSGKTEPTTNDSANAQSAPAPAVDTTKVDSSATPVVDSPKVDTSAPKH